MVSYQDIASAELNTDDFSLIQLYMYAVYFGLSMILAKANA